MPCIPCAPVAPVEPVTPCIPCAPVDSDRTGYTLYPLRASRSGRSYCTLNSLRPGGSGGTYRPLRNQRHIQTGHMTRLIILFAIQQHIRRTRRQRQPIIGRRICHPALNQSRHIHRHKLPRQRSSKRAYRRSHRWRTRRRHAVLTPRARHRRNRYSARSIDPIHKDRQRRPADLRRS